MNFSITDIRCLRHWPRLSAALQVPRQSEDDGPRDRGVVRQADQYVDVAQRQRWSHLFGRRDRQLLPGRGDRRSRTLSARRLQAGPATAAVERWATIRSS